MNDIEKDAARYRWLKSRKGLDLRTDGSEWTRVDGIKFRATHSLAEGDTRYSPEDNLDALIDKAMAYRSGK